MTVHPYTWNALPNILKIAHFQTSSESFLLLVSLSHPARSKLTRYINVSGFFFSNPILHRHLALARTDSTAIRTCSRLFFF